jgi:hypothetical protein
MADTTAKAGGPFFENPTRYLVRYESDWRGALAVDQRLVDWGASLCS